MIARLKTADYAVALLCTVMAAAEAPSNAIDASKAIPSEDGAIHWYDAKNLPFEGQAWEDVAHPYDRLPARAEGMVRPPVWSLSHDSAGIAARFVSNSKTIHVRWSLRSKTISMNHMPATGDSGIDLYVVERGEYRWAGVGRPKKQIANENVLIEFETAADRAFIMYFPLYNGIEKAEIGVDAGAYLAPAPPRPEEQSKPIVFYGTSITQGGCASRPGAAHTAILGRWLDRPVINLGFSGNGQMDPEFVELISSIDAACYLIDCIPNMEAEQVAERAESFLRKLHEAKPDVPIVAVECIFPRNGHMNGRLAEIQKRNALLKAAYDTLSKEIRHGLYYIPGDDLLGHDGEGTVDGVHPTDLGFLRMAEEFRPILKRAIAASK